MTEKQRTEIVNGVVKGIMDANTPRESDAEKKCRIMGITNTIERQRAIRENIGLFSGDVLIGGKKIEDL